MDHYMIGVIVLLVAIFIARVINDRANKKLDQDKKAELIDLFSKGSIYTYGILLGILGLFFLNLKLNWIDYGLAFVIYIIALVGYSVVTNYRAYKKLKSYNFPDRYIKDFLISSSLRLLGLIFFFTILMLD